ncbi:MAG TPA: MmgE/PrpD family protein [Roseiarcus sp.]|jgi:2-methylcitrate dehydratase|nr:MmgE/PrpD family protein [Roseiarcus sp.]
MENASARKLTEVRRLGRFVAAADIGDMPADGREELRKRILDSVGVAIAALSGEPIRLVRAQIDDFGGRPTATLIGGGKTAPDRAAFYNGALVRYLDFMDSYLAKGETCHPSDNLGAVLAAAEYADQDGENLLAAMAVAYQVQCRLCDVAPVRAKGFDHTVQGAYAVAAGVARALGLDAEKAANAIAISGACNNALRVTRTGALSHWKGLAFPNTAFVGTHAAFLAYRGVTGPEEVFEGNKGFKQTIAGPFEIDWSSEGLDAVKRTILKKYDAEIHSQTSIEGALELKTRHAFAARDVATIEIDTFDVAYDIIGGGEEGDKTIIRTKEEADHSLPYMVGAALLDGAVSPAQYNPERIGRADIQNLLRRIVVRPKKEYSDRFPAEMCSAVRVTLADGRTFQIEKRDYEGFVTRPMDWKTVIAKFDSLAEPFASKGARDRIIDQVQNLERTRVHDFTSVLADLSR